MNKQQLADLLREPSTKRGIVWMIGGGYVLYKAWSGQSVDADAISKSIDFWLGVVMTVAGGFGLLPDTKHVERHSDASSDCTLTGFNDASQADDRRPPRPLVDATRTPTVANQAGYRRVDARGPAVPDPSADRVRDAVSSDHRSGSDSSVATRPNVADSSVGWGDRS